MFAGNKYPMLCLISNIIYGYFHYWFAAFMSYLVNVMINKMERKHCVVIAITLFGMTAGESNLTGTNKT